MCIFRSGLSYSVSRTLYKMHSKSLKLTVLNVFRSQGMCVKVSGSGVRKTANDRANVESKSAKTKGISPSKTVTSYVMSRANTIDISTIPAKYLRKVKKLSEGQYLIDDNSASFLAEKILSNNFVENDTPLFEVNPGIGLLTKYLLENGVPKINVFQSAFWSPFLQISDKYPERIRMYEYDFFAFWRYLLLEVSERSDNADIIIKTIEPKKWNDGPVMKIILTVPNKMFFNQLISSTIFQNGLICYGRIEMFLLTTPLHYLQLTGGKEAGYSIYRPNTVLFQLLFEYKMLGKVPRKDFIPWEQVKQSTISKGVKLSAIEEDAFYLVRVVPRRDLFEKIGEGDNLKALWHFVLQCLSRRKNRVIPTLENWIPGCGPRLIVKGFNIFTEFGELSPSEILSVFQEFIMWPEYSTSSFLPSMHTTLLKKYVDMNKDGADEHDLEVVVEDNLDDDSQVHESI